MKIRIGTRGSKLALWQAYHISDLLSKGGIDSEIVTIETKGDKILDVTISKIGSKGVFTEEIEEQLLSGQIDIAVHSAKDMQSELPQDFELIAFTTREKVNDVIVSRNQSLSIEDESKPFKLGTSSTRRLATLKRHYPHIETVPIRGNLQRRISKMDEGQCDALLLAYAGVHRMEYDDLIVEHLSLDKFIPPVGQGSVAIEVAKNLDAEKKAIVRKLTNDPDTEKRLLSERAFLKKLQGGCSVPVFALANLDGNNLSIVGGVTSLDGQVQIKENASGNIENAESIGLELAEKVINAGGKELLAEIKSQL
ncbi:hydroxymethylbilane synthase [Aureibacter tunicatorum]|uniref:Porphobilinogen deaminase n=1 Tax=Aureibacter tunicatorum TaxID=866807 RepID=A0AAE4BNP0_9BACT|nr:hydroxymethylbilane synthase [Aureibacter tunicatorum]MDR6237039.1 hydroxymethylbilane synthase [Aureibacter tunicatorum]BDD06031.1 porphobilinogen deaminase [Aureibacter tunicatorum]